MKKLFYLLSLLLATVLANAAELNVYASGLKIMGMTDDRQLSISYFLNAPADEVTFLLLDGETPNAERPVLSLPLSGKSVGENFAVINLSAYEGVHYTWAIKAKSNTANTAPVTKVVDCDTDKRFAFYSAQGLAVDNCPNSPYFGRIYVTESRSGQSVKGRNTNEGVYIFGADLSDITGQGDAPYAGGRIWNESSGEEINSPSRLTVDEDGWVYVCDNSSMDTKNSGVWRMNPATPSAVFKDVLGNDANYGKNGKVAKNLYKRINSAVVEGTTTSEKYLVAMDNPGSDSGEESRLVRFRLNADGVSDETSEQMLDLKQVVYSATNTIVRGAYDDYWIFPYRNSSGTHAGIIHVKKDGGGWTRDLNIGLNYNRRGSGAVSVDGKYLAFNGVDNGNCIRILEVAYDENKTPILDFANKVWARITDTGERVDGIAFDVAGNFYFVSADDSKSGFYAFALKKDVNEHTTIAPNSQQIRLTEPRILAYNLRADLKDGVYQFSFDANSQPTTAKLLFYAESSRETLKYEKIVENPKKGVNVVSVPMNEIVKAIGTSDLYWSVQLAAEPINIFGEVFQHSMRLARGHAAIDNSPASDYFGRIYIANRIGNNQGEIYVLNHNYSTILANGLCEPNFFASAARPAVDAEGYIYWADFGDSSHGGVYVTDPSNLTKTSSFFNGTVENNGVWKNGSVALGSSSCGVHVYSNGANTKLFMMNEDKVGTLPAHGYCVYNIGQNDGTIKRSWGEAPSQTVTVTGNEGTNFAIVGTSHGAFLCQNRTFRNNTYNALSLQFYDNAGVRQFSSEGNANINGSFGGGLAVSADEKQLAMVNGFGDILLFNINWNGDVPTLELNTTYPTNYAAISTIHFDYAGNLVVMAGMGYAAHGITNDHRLVVFAQPTNDNRIIVPAPTSQTISPMLYLDDKVDNSELLENENVKNKPLNVRITRSLTGGMYNTLCLPFTLSSLEGTCLEGAKAYAYDHSEEFGGDIMLHFNLTSILNAGVPYLVEPQEDIASPMDFMDVRVTVAEGASVSSNDIAFTGILSPLKLTANDKSILFLVSDNRLAWANTTAEMYGMRGYFAVPEGKYNKLSTRAYINTKESATTGLQTPIIEKVTTKFIHNGVLYILRDGAIYTIMGTKMQ